MNVKSSFTGVGKISAVDGVTALVQACLFSFGGVGVNDRFFACDVGELDALFDKNDFNSRMSLLAFLLLDDSITLCTRSLSLCAHSCI